VTCVAVGAADPIAAGVGAGVAARSPSNAATSSAARVGSARSSSAAAPAGCKRAAKARTGCSPGENTIHGQPTEPGSSGVPCSSRASSPACSREVLPAPDGPTTTRGRSPAVVRAAAATKSAVSRSRPKKYSASSTVHVVEPELARRAWVTLLKQPDQRAGERRVLLLLRSERELLGGGEEVQAMRGGQREGRLSAARPQPGAPREAAVEHNDDRGGAAGGQRLTHRGEGQRLMRGETGGEGVSAAGGQVQLATRAEQSVAEEIDNGSALRKRDGKDGGLVWAPAAGAALRAVRTFGGSVRGLRLPEGVGDEHPGDGVVPVAVMPDLHASRGVDRAPGLWAAAGVAAVDV
jgi:hypothetical protein